jgi:hypothetical protein
MTRSEQINELAGALTKAQRTMTGAKKDSLNPHFGKSYADLASVWDACREPLTLNGLSIVQSPRLVSAGENAWIVEVETTLLHTSGQFMTDTMAVPVARPDAQGVGSATTYARRYSLAAFVGVAPEDDDANEASRPATNGHAAVSAPKQAEPARGAGGSILATVSDVKDKSGKSKSTGKPYTKFVITADGKDYATFKREDAELAKSAKASGATVEITYTQTQFGLDLMGIAMATGAMFDAHEPPPLDDTDIPF